MTASRSGIDRSSNTEQSILAGDIGGWNIWTVASRKSVPARQICESRGNQIGCRISFEGMAVLTSEARRMDCKVKDAIVILLHNSF
jgi:hypothetical protein